MQSLEPLLIFITVAEMGSFTRAADSLGIQKGRASTAVRKLEEDVGVRLLHRTTRSVQLTEDGRVFHARARDLLAEVDDLHSMFASDRVALRGRLRVDLPTEVARTTIVPALPELRDCATVLLDRLVSCRLQEATRRPAHDRMGPQCPTYSLDTNAAHGTIRLSSKHRHRGCAGDGAAR